LRLILANPRLLHAPETLLMEEERSNEIPRVFCSVCWWWDGWQPLPSRGTQGSAFWANFGKFVFGRIVLNEIHGSFLW